MRYLQYHCTGNQPPDCAVSTGLYALRRINVLPVIHSVGDIWMLTHISQLKCVL